MQVSDSQAAQAGPAAKDEIHPAGDEAVDRGRSRSGRGFRSALERKGGDSSGGAHDVASAAALAGWFRSEWTSGSSPTGAPARTPNVAAARAVDRILVGSGPEGAQARIRIGAGALAGTEIQLSSSGARRAVEAQLLTHAASSRQTLSVVMDEIRSRLRDRGIVLCTKAPPARSIRLPGEIANVGEGQQCPPTGERR
jgi:hypothetical protein